MLNYLKKLVKLKEDTKAATAIEYGLIAAGVAIAIAVLIGTVGDDVASTFSKVSSSLQ
jgi:pilus assembly protein Flp/PilA